MSRDGRRVKNDPRRAARGGRPREGRWRSAPPWGGDLRPHRRSRRRRRPLLFRGRIGRVLAIEVASLVSRLQSVGGAKVLLHVRDDLLVGRVIGRFDTENLLREILVP